MKYKNRIFNKTFWKFFVITFAVIQFVAIASAVSEYFDRLMYYSTPFAFEFYLTTSMLVLPASLFSAIAVSSFVSFRCALINGSKDFFKLWGFGFVCFLVFSIGIYQYDCNIQPKIKQQSMKMFWEIKTGRIYPEKIEEKPNQNASLDKMPEFENITLSVLSGEEIRSASDSVKRQQQQQIHEVRELLAVLPFALAEEAYESYNLDRMGVEFQYAKTVELSSDSLTYIQQVLLYEEASLLSENIINLIKYKIENYRRAINAVCCLLSFLIFAALGYLLKNKSLSKIFGIIAVVIVSIYMLYLTTHLMEVYFKGVIKSIR